MQNSDGQGHKTEWFQGLPHMSVPPPQVSPANNKFGPKQFGRQIASILLERKKTEKLGVQPKIPGKGHSPKQVDVPRSPAAMTELLTVAAQEELEEKVLANSARIGTAQDSQGIAYQFSASFLCLWSSQCSKIGVLLSLLHTCIFYFSTQVLVVLEVCQISLSEASKEHHQKSPGAQLVKGALAECKGTCWCDLCEEDLDSLEDLEAHLKLSTHTEMVKSIAIPWGKGPQKYTKQFPFFCKICRIS